MVLGSCNSVHTGEVFSWGSGARGSESRCGQCWSFGGCEGEPVRASAGFRAPCRSITPAQLWLHRHVLFSASKCPLSGRTLVMSDHRPPPATAVSTSGPLPRSWGPGLQPTVFGRAQVNPPRAVVIVIDLTALWNFLSIARIPHANRKLGCPPWCWGQSRDERGRGQGGDPALVLL